MKKRMIYLMVLGLLLTGCGEETEELKPSHNLEEIVKTDSENDELTIDETETQTNGEKEENEEKEDSEEAVPQIDVTLLKLQQEDICYEEWGDYDIVCHSLKNSIHLEEETKNAYPELSKSLDKLRSENIEEIVQFMDNFTEAAHEEESNESFSGYKSECKYFVQRADHQILSIREDFYEYTGGAHGIAGSFGENFDPETGKSLVITDVVKDLSELISLVDEKLINQYGDEAFSDTPKESLLQYAVEDFEWTMSYQGLSLYFHSLNLNGYGSEEYMVTIWFDEAPELFVDNYMAQPEGHYAMALPEGREIAMKICPGDDVEDTLSLNSMTDEATGWYQRLVFHINGQDYCSDEVYNISELSGHLVCLKNGEKEKFFIYAAMSFELHHQIAVYELTENGVVYCGSMENARFPGEWNSETNSYFGIVLNDPTKFELVSRTDLVGVVDGVKVCEADWETGLPKTQSDDYKITADWCELTLKRPLVVEVLPEGDKEEILAGTTFKYLRTDNKTYVDFLMEDGRESRVYTEEVEEETVIRGENPNMIFEGLPTGF